MTLILGGCDDQPRNQEEESDLAYAGESITDRSLSGETALIQDAEVDAELDAGLSPRELIDSVSIERTLVLDGLTAPVEVMFTEGMVPNIYAENETDLGQTLGYLLARDRFFSMDLLRRLPQGRLSELFGNVALVIDQENLDLGMGYVTDRLVERLSPRTRAYFEAITIGMNTYIEAVRAGSEEPPSEFKLAAPLFITSAVDLMTPWTVHDVVSMATTILYQTNFRDHDLEATERLFNLAESYGDDVERREAFIADVALNMKPPINGNSMRPDPQWGEGNPWSLGVAPVDDMELPLDDSGMNDMGIDDGGVGDGGAEKEESNSKEAQPVAKKMAHSKLITPSQQGVSLQLLNRLRSTLAHRHQWFGHDHKVGFGSNAWAASSRATHAGAIVSGDGHLQLSIPSLMYQVGLNTQELGGGDFAQKGLLIASIPVLAVGTNGKVAWSQVNPIVDITDWYEEKLLLDEEGLPRATLFQGEEKPLVTTTHRVNVAERAILMSEAQVVEWTSYQTFDGRRIVQIDGRELAPDEEVAEGEVVITVLGRRIVPATPREDGTITAISFDYGAFDASHFVDALFELGFTKNLDEFEQQTKRFVGGGLFSAAGDYTGSILYSSYQAIPCRSYLNRNEEGFFNAGESPMALLDGTRVGGFTLPVNDEGYVDESNETTDHCVIPYQQMPISRDPAQGFVVTTNNDPLGFADDGRVDNDPWYLGGPWTPFRHHTVTRTLGRALDEGPINLETMRTAQNNIESRLGELFVPHLIKALDQVSDWTEEGGEMPDPSREVAMNHYNDHRLRLQEVRQRLNEWKSRGYLAQSGVETFYNTVDDNERNDAVATMIFNATLRELLKLVWSDEEEATIPYDETRLKIYALARMFTGRGPNNPQGLASWSAEFNESLFFDRLDTPDHYERSEELVILAFLTALDKLAATPETPEGFGFGSDNMSHWLWGMVHLGRFESLLGPFLGDAGPLGVLLERFSVTTKKLPLLEELPSDDPRTQLDWFPRPGDQWAVDAGNPGFNGKYSFGNGSVMRMTIQLNGNRVSGYNILPGGQSGFEDSPHLLDQLRLWLANDAYPLRYHLEEVVAGTTARWQFTP